MRNSIFGILLLSLLIGSCKKETGLGKIVKTDGKIAPDGFNFETSKKVNITIRLLSNINEPLKGIITDVKATSGTILLTGVTDASGTLTGTVNIPAYVDTLMISPNNAGLTQDVKGLIVNHSFNCTIGGDNGGSGNILMNKGNSKVFSGKNTDSFSALSYSYAGTYDSFGRPINYLDPQKGAVTANMLTYLAESLPEQKDVRVHHPAYVTTNATEHLNIVKTSDVWVTFVSEGALYTNTVGFYTYTTGNPPNNTNQIGDIKMIFPNTSGVGSGGNLQSGDRVKLGRFNAGTSIGFVLFQNSWRQNLNTVNTSAIKFYSDARFNPEGTADLRKHSVLLNFAPENLFIIGFEDKRRDASDCDQDFNDVVLYGTSIPTDAISTAGVQGMDPPKDTDGDGVWDVNDKFPLDANKAFISYFPSSSTYGTLAFEDKWPNKDDYDMNDLVVKYRYAYVTSASNQVAEINASFIAVAAWATNTNGFGVQLPFASSAVSSVTGHKLTRNIISLNPNGTEAGQSKAVIIPFDNQSTLLLGPTGFKDSVQLKIVLTSPINLATVGNGPYNPFLIGNGQRGFEVHLPGQLPTDKADNSFFGTADDRTNLSLGKYYLSAENWPWAISFTEHFYYPIEGNGINLAYLHFAEWASSGGTKFADWYKNTGPGYRDAIKIQQNQ
ncbi:MAG TPA: LruC domain-containing protein [Pedobacter sp.]|jgi:LruC domain-containing protein